MLIFLVRESRELENKHVAHLKVLSNNLKMLNRDMLDHIPCFTIPGNFHLMHFEY